MESREFWVVNKFGYFFKVEDFNESSDEQIKAFEAAGLKVLWTIEECFKFVSAMLPAYEDIAEVDGFEIMMESDLEGGWTVSDGIFCAEVHDIVQYIADYEV